MAKTPRFSEDQYQLLLAKAQGKPLSSAPTAASAPEPSSQPAKRRGAAANPILRSLESPEIVIECSPTHFTIILSGARLFSLNELFSLLQCRKYVVFDYKKRLKTLVRNAMRRRSTDLPRFDGTCSLKIFRQGKKLIDQDSLAVMFKFIVDALKDDPSEAFRGVFSDDNPAIIQEYELLQNKGEPVVGIRIDVQPPTDRISASAAWLLDDPKILPSCEPSAPLPIQSPKKSPSAKRKTKAPTPEAGACGDGADPS